MSEEQVAAPETCIERAGISEPILAVVEALRFRHRSIERMKQLDAKQWPKLLEWCDSRQVTLMLPHFCGAALPPDIRERIAKRRTGFEMRLELIKRQLAAIAEVLQTRNIPCVVLKGFTHSPDLTPDPVWRAQGDIDLWCPHELADTAYAAARELGYGPSPAQSGRHLPPLVLPNSWEWNGNLAEIPIAVEIHHRLWNEISERIDIAGQEQMWARRESRTFDGKAYQVLAKQDLLGFAALHFFLHLIGGDLPLQRAWEVAHFLHQHSNDEQFWRQCNEWHSPELKAIETIVCSVVQSWFHCAAPPHLELEREALPTGVQFWLQQFVFSPLCSQTDSNKNYVYLHMAMASKAWSKMAVLAASLWPGKLPTVVDRIDGGNTASVLASLIRQRKYLLLRGKRYVCSFLPTASGGIAWVRKRTGFEKGFGPFLLAGALFDVGEFLFVLLYNLYLLDRGFREDVLGLVAAAMTVGMLAGTPLAAIVERKAGLRGLLIIGAVGGAIATVLRTVSMTRINLLGSAALNGIFFAFWAVAFAPVVAALTRPRNRSIAFGFVTAMGMSIGIAAGFLGARLPQWISSIFACSVTGGKKGAIFLGSGLVLLAAIPALRLRIPGRQQHGAVTYPRGPFVRKFLMALFLWIAATTSFNSFGTAYLSLRLHMSLQEIGTAFSTGQALQVCAMMCGPLLVRRLGDGRYVFLTALGTAIMLMLLAFGQGWMAIALYLGYLTLQYMNEPSLFGLLMNNAEEGQRTGASSLMFLTMSVAGTLAAAIAGRAITRLGYPICLAVAAIVATIAALVFRSLLKVGNEHLAAPLHNYNNTEGRQTLTSIQ